MPFANSTGILNFKSGYKLMQAISHLFRWKAPQDYAWKCSLLHYGFLWSNSAMVWFWGRSDWTDTFQNTFAFENGGLSAKRTVLERYTCRANLEQAEQFRHDSYELPKSLKYQGLLLMQNPGHGVNHKCLVFYFRKHVGKGTPVTAVSPEIISNTLGMHQHNCKDTFDQKKSVCFWYSEEGELWSQISWVGILVLLLTGYMNLAGPQLVHLQNRENILQPRIVVLNCLG